MENNIFRQKSINKINSPESLNDYVKVTNPSVWFILIGIVILIMGAALFGTIGTVNTTVQVAIEVVNGEITAYIDEVDIDKVTSNMTVRFNDNDYSINIIASKPVKYSEVDEYVLHKGGLEFSQWLYPITVSGTTDDDVYKGTIVVERISPVSYVFN